MSPSGLKRGDLAQLSTNAPTRSDPESPKLLKVSSGNGKVPKVTIKPLPAEEPKFSLSKGSDLDIRKQNDKKTKKSHLGNSVSAQGWQSLT